LLGRSDMLDQISTFEEQAQGIHCRRGHSSRPHHDRDNEDGPMSEGMATPTAEIQIIGASIRAPRNTSRRTNTFWSTRHPLMDQLKSTQRRESSTASAPGASVSRLKARQVQVTLEEVLHVPGMESNLLSSKVLVGKRLKTACTLPKGRISSSATWRK